MSPHHRRTGWLLAILVAGSAAACAEGDTRAPLSGDAGLIVEGGAMVDAGAFADALPGADAAGPCQDLDCSTMTDMCNVGTCNPETGACEPMPSPDGTVCDDDDLCTVPDTCSMGVCMGRAVDCSRLSEMCNVGACNAMTGGCELVPAADETVCDDGDMCTVPDVCTMGTCGGRAVDCSALSAMCHTGMCNATTGGCEAIVVADGTTCDDGDAATSGDMCSMGVCGGSASTSVMFPTSAAQVCNTTGSCTTLGSGGGGRFFRRGDYLEETVRFAGTSTLTALSLNFEMSDLTGGCAVGATHTFNVMVAGRSVGTYAFVTGAAPALRRTISERYSFAGTPASGGGATSDAYTIRITAATTVCSGGSSWNWFPGGTASP